MGSGAVKAYDTHMAVSTTAWLSAPVPFKRTDILHGMATLPGLSPDMNIVGNNIETGGAALSWLGSRSSRLPTDYWEAAAGSVPTVRRR
ncbi:MAG: hypothetical protein H6528_12735 [Actinobacteria bacterium]|nr:hypothetical protein [Actinomycetota bacterium]